MNIYEILKNHHEKKITKTVRISKKEIVWLTSYFSMPKNKKKILMIS